LYDSAGDADQRVVAALHEVAKARGVPHGQVALAWLLGNAAVTAPIIGATKLAHLEDAVAALAVELTDAERKALEAPYVPHAIAGHS
jgi:1-deoxyxylulose-5-phosphate synthase